jgi:hypothetical protein
VTYGYVVVLQVVLSPVLEHNDKHICGTIIIVFIRKQHGLSSNYVMQMLVYVCYAKCIVTIKVFVESDFK